MFMKENLFQDVIWDMQLECMRAKGHTDSMGLTIYGKKIWKFQLRGKW